MSFSNAMMFVSVHKTFGRIGKSWKSCSKKLIFEGSCDEFHNNRIHPLELFQPSSGMLVDCFTSPFNLVIDGLGSDQIIKWHQIRRTKVVGLDLWVVVDWYECTTLLRTSTTI